MKAAPSLLACCAAALLALACCLTPPAPARDADDEAPKASDPRLVVERFAAAPDIVHPVNIAFDARGRLLVIESHTHFRPASYDGPEHDRVRVLEDTDGDGKADRFTTFFEGTRATMDIAVHPDGSVYLATRNEVLRLRDTDGDGKADERQRVALLDTKGDYPHNGLSGLAFDSKGNLYFGMGENLGAGYQLVGSDGTTIAGGGEGGNVFWCTADGKHLRRVATGFWNPFGVCTDVYGRLFAVDNDPDEMPPCRLLHVVEGGDYGYQFRYGRSGRHPFQAWNGQLPGTLPMAGGTGEAPCEVVSYESDGLPREYLGDLLVTAWADHRVERYVVSEQGASVSAERKPFVQGGKNFRPVGLAVAPDGSLFVSDWVLSDYQLHGRGAVWHIRTRDQGKPDRPKDPRRALASAHRPLRESAARQLADEGAAGRAFLREQLTAEDPRVRAAALTALVDADDRQTDLAAVAEKDPLTPLRALAVRALASRGGDARRFFDPKYPPAVRMEAVASLKEKSDRPRLLDLLTDADPFLRHAAVRQLAQAPGLLADLDWPSLADARQRAGVLLAHRAGGRGDAAKLATDFLRDPDPEVRFLAAKWVADEKLADCRPPLAEALKDPRLPLRLYFAYASALARLDGRDVSEAGMAGLFFGRVTDPQTPPETRGAALRLVPPTHRPLTVSVLTKLLAQDDETLQTEAVRVLREHPDPRRHQALLDVARDPRHAEGVRAEALVGVAERSQDAADVLLAFAQGDRPALRDEALRAFTNTKLTDAQRDGLAAVAKRELAAADLVARALGRPFAKDRPRPDDLPAWLKRLEGPADVDAGRRVFFHPKLAACSRCHRVEGRGADIGPDLSAVGRTERRHLLESILQPSNLVAPHYQVWSITTANGKEYSGMLLRTVLDEYTYVDAKGEQFKLNTRDIAEARATPRSVMPDGLADLLTDQELRDLLAYLASRR
jgi:putative membrane-bound dehydrogenase-like protein